MALSNDLLSQFAKLVNNDKKTSSESTVYGTVSVDSDGNKYVQLDGSDQLTPLSDTTVDNVKDGERVSILIKNHTATVNGNVSSPSASTIDVDQKVSDSEIRVKSLFADEATINELTVNKATIVDLVAKRAVIEELIANKATITDLIANTAVIEYLQANKASILNLIAKQATIDNLIATNATIEDLYASKAEINTLLFGSATGNTIHTDFANSVIASLGDAQIKSAMIASLDASKINAGSINTNFVNVSSDDGKLLISDETIQIKDDTRVRVQIGKDASGDYSINIWDTDGKLMFSEGGITDSAIKDAIIRNDMVAADANISGEKIDISSLITAVNKNTGEETIDANKILVDTENGKLDVAFKQMKTNVGTLSGTVQSQGTALGIVQGQINTKIWQQDIDSVKIGARNLVLKSDTQKEITKTSDDSINVGTYYLTDYGKEMLITDIKVMVSFDLKASANGFDVRPYLRDSDNITYHSLTSPVRTTTSWVRHEIPIVLNKDKPIRLHIIASTQSGSTGVTYEVRNVKCEIGNKATDWSPAPEDLENVTSQLSTKYSELKQDVDGFKTTVSETYSTIGQVNTIEERVSNVEQTSESITSTVSSIKIGARNLVLKSDIPHEKTKADDSSVDIGNYNLTDYGKEMLTTDVEVMVSFDLKASANDFDVRPYLRDSNDVSCHSLTSPVKTTTSWVRHEIPIVLNKDEAIRLRILANTHSGSAGVTYEVRNVKCEIGNKATDWSPAPEEVDEKATDAQVTADGATSLIVQAQSEIQQLADSISSLVRTGNSGTLVTQDAKGLWFFDISNLESAVNNTSNGLAELDGLVLDESGRIDVLESTASALESQVEYVKSYTDDNGKPCLELGEGDSTFKVYITNEQISFADGSSTPAYLSNQKLYIEQAEVTNELQFGGFVWRIRENGNMGLVWKGVGS